MITSEILIYQVSINNSGQIKSKSYVVLFYTMANWSTNHNEATANDVLVALNTLGSSVKEVYNQIQSIIK